MKHKNRNLVLTLFLLSGLVSLVFQVVWLKLLVKVFGNTVWAVSTLLTAFMAGLALGSWLFGKVADVIKSPLKLYGAIEGIIGIFALITPVLFDILPGLYRPLYHLAGGDNTIMGIFKFLMAFVILIIPTVLMGGTLPLLAKHFTDNIVRAGADIGYLYTINTFGAVLGTFVSGFILIPHIGLNNTVFAASMVNFIILLAIFRITRSRKMNIKGGLSEIIKKRLEKREKNFILWVFLACGFTALSYEIMWNRILVLHIGSSVYAYSVMLAVYLFGIALGSAIMSYFVPRIKRPGVVFAIIQFGIAFYLIIQVKQFSNLTVTISNMGNVIGVESYITYVLSLLLGTVQSIILPTVLFGASFPLAVKLFVKQKNKLGTETGTLYAFNTVGTIFGSFAAGFIILPLIGVQRGLFLTAVVNLGIGSFLLYKSLDNKKVVFVSAAFVFALFISGYLFFTEKDEVILEAGIFSDSENSEVEVIDFSEDIYATVTVEERRDVSGTWKSLSMNGVNVAGTSCELFTIQKMQGHLPLLLHKYPKKVLHIGFGSGGTAWSVSCHPVDKITIAEISRSIIEKSSKYFIDVNHNVLEDPRVEVRYTDGRNYVLASDEKYDVILSDSIHPRFSGNGSLYTYEYYKLLRDSLHPGGLVSQWLPFYSITPENFKMIIKSFYRVFPYTSVWYINSTINSYVIVIGKTDSGAIDFSDVQRKIGNPRVNADLSEINTNSVYKVLDFFFFANERVGEFVGDVPLHTDDNMAVEYNSGRVVSRYTTSLSNFYELLRYNTSIEPYLININGTGDTAGDIIDSIRRYENATYHNLNGQLLFLLGKREKAFENFDLIPVYNPEDLEPVEYFGASYQRPFLKMASMKR